MGFRGRGSSGDGRVSLGIWAGPKWNHKCSSKQEVGRSDRRREGDERSRLQGCPLKLEDGPTGRGAQVTSESEKARK